MGQLADVLYTICLSVQIQNFLLLAGNNRDYYTPSARLHYSFVVGLLCLIRPHGHDNTVLQIPADSQTHRLATNYLDFFENKKNNYLN
jgi:hypothetical protein